MTHSPTCQKAARAVAHERRRRVPLWPDPVIAAALSMLFSLPAATETERSIELIERALALEPNQRGGAALYREHCASCQGERGEGNEEHATPALQGQHYSYLLMQARLLSVGHRYSVDATIAETLRMLPYDYLVAIADYASRLPADAPELVAEPPEDSSRDIQ